MSIQRLTERAIAQSPLLHGAGGSEGCLLAAMSVS